MDFTITNGSIIIATIFWLSQKYKKTIRPEYVYYKHHHQDLSLPLSA